MAGFGAAASSEEAEAWVKSFEILSCGFGAVQDEDPVESSEMGATGADGAAGFGVRASPEGAAAAAVTEGDDRVVGEGTEAGAELLLDKEGAEDARVVSVLGAADAVELSEGGVAANEPLLESSGAGILGQLWAISGRGRQRPSTGLLDYYSLRDFTISTSLSR